MELNVDVNIFNWLVLNPHLVATLCSSFSRENGYPLLICSSLSTAQLKKYLGKSRVGTQSHGEGCLEDDVPFQLGDF